MTERKEHAIGTWNSYPRPRYHTSTWTREFFQRMRTVLESSADTSGRISAALWLGVYLCPVELIETTDDPSNRHFHPC